MAENSLEIIRPSTSNALATTTGTSIIDQNVNLADMIKKLSEEREKIANMRDILNKEIKNVQNFTKNHSAINISGDSATGQLLDKCHADDDEKIFKINIFICVIILVIMIIIVMLIIRIRHYDYTVHGNVVAPSQIDLDRTNTYTLPIMYILAFLVTITGIVTMRIDKRFNHLSGKLIYILVTITIFFGAFMCMSVNDERIETRNAIRSILYVTSIASVILMIFLLLTRVATYLIWCKR
jgi:hypothetical protein